MEAILKRVSILSAISSGSPSPPLTQNCRHSRCLQLTPLAFCSSDPNATSQRSWARLSYGTPGRTPTEHLPHLLPTRLVPTRPRLPPPRLRSAGSSLLPLLRHPSPIERVQRRTLNRAVVRPRCPKAESVVSQVDTTLPRTRTMPPALPSLTRPRQMNLES